MNQNLMDQKWKNLGLYYRDVGHVQPKQRLSREEECQLGILAQAGDQKAKDRLVEANLLFVIDTAQKYQDSGVPLPDLIEAGNLGAIIAANHFDGTKGYKFISYAVWWIRQMILLEIALARPIRLPLNQIGLLHQISRTTDVLRQKFDTEPQIEEVAEALGADVHKIRAVLERGKGVKSLDSIFKNREDTLYEILKDTSIPFPDKEAEDESLRKGIERVLKTLPEREAEIVRLYYGLSDRGERTVSEIGEIFKVSKQRVSQIKIRALNRLRHPDRKKQLKEIRGY